MTDRCPCGTWMVAGLRYEMGGTVAISLCLSCWREEPPYQKPRARPQLVAEPKLCRHCRQPLRARSAARVYCSLACRRAHERERSHCVCACGAEFDRPPSWSGRRESLYCSRACMRRYGVGSRHRRAS